MTPFTELMDVILSPLKSSAIHGAANLAANISTTVQLCVTLYIILYGWQIARGEIAEPWNEFAKRAVKLCLIVAVLQSPALYKEYVIDFLAESLPDALSNAMSGNPVPNANKFDTLAAKFGILLTQVWQGTGWSAPAATARAAVVTLLVMPFVWGSLILGFVVTMWAKAGMYFVATLGPLFIALAMFEQTRRYLHNWLDQIVTMIALQVLVAMTCGLVLEGLERAVRDAPTPENVFALAGKVIVLAVFSLAIWSSLPRLASKLGGYGASVAGAGARAAPMDTLRAPLGSFSEHGAAPIGRSELASNASRTADTRTEPAITPAPIIGPARGADAAAASSREATRSGAVETPGRTSNAARAEGASIVAADPTTRSTTTGPDETQSNAYSSLAASLAVANAVPEPVASSRAEVAVASTVAPVNDHLAASETMARPDAGTRSTIFEPPPSVQPIGPSAYWTSKRADDDPLIASQLTGFEGVDFEQAASRAADVSLATNDTSSAQQQRLESIGPTAEQPPLPEYPSTSRSSS